MKTITKFVTAALFAVTVAAPAFADDPEAQTLQERNTYVYANGPTAKPVREQSFAHANRATEAFAQAPAQTRDINVRDLGAGSQS
jgi:hypothetical protein